MGEEKREERGKRREESREERRERGEQRGEIGEKRKENSGIKQRSKIQNKDKSYK